MEELMKKKIYLFVMLMLTLSFALVGTAAANGGGQSTLAEVRAGTAKFHDPEAAQAAGWDLVPGLDHCFNNPGVGAMGYHYINLSLLDLEVNASTPEALVYAPDDNGKLHLAAVEYVVPAQAWDDAGNTELPKLLGQTFHLNAPLGVYILHAWVWRPNPAGMFEDWNPNVTCDD
jgi:hypothetical protein